MAVTSMYLPFGRPASRFISDSATLALCLPYSSSSSSSMPRPAAISAMGFMRARCAISRSDSMGRLLLSRSSRGRYPPGRTAARIASMRTAQTLYSGIFDDGIVGGIREEVRRRVGELDEGDEDGARAHRLGEAREAVELAASRRDADRVAGLHAEAARVRRMERHLEARGQLEQSLDAAGHGAAVPVIEQPSRVEHERVVRVGQLGRGRGLHARGRSGRGRAERNRRRGRACPGGPRVGHGHWSPPSRSSRSWERPPRKGMSRAISSKISDGAAVVELAARRRGRGAGPRAWRARR